MGKQLSKLLTPPPEQPYISREKIFSYFSGPVATHPQTWDELWAQGFLPWDKGFPNPALVDLLAERQDLISSRPSANGKRKRALVPGCGKGYDVLLLSACGFDTYGLDVSPKALEAAKKTERRLQKRDIYQTRKGVKRGKVIWLNGNFLEDTFLKKVKGEGTFDLIYDYTFLSALPPSVRPAWSKRVVDLLAPGGKVVCIEFPTSKPPLTGGPPWALPPKVYLGHLQRPGEELPYNANDGLLEDQLGEPSSTGLQRIEHFRPKRTHKLGYNTMGDVTDWVGVWAHPSPSR